MHVNLFEVRYNPLVKSKRERRCTANSQQEAFFRNQSHQYLPISPSFGLSALVQSARAMSEDLYISDCCNRSIRPTRIMRAVWRRLRSRSGARNFVRSLEHKIRAVYSQRKSRQEQRRWKQEKGVPRGQDYGEGRRRHVQYVFSSCM